MSDYKIASKELAEAEDTDIVVYNGPISRPYDQGVIEACLKRRRRKNVFLILTTVGGDADAAYRIAKCFQNHYEKFTCCIPGFCKSAGTLIALGANELVFGDHGEIGPLDVQLQKKEELGERQSGLTVATAIETLQSQAYSMFETTLLKMKNRGLSLKVAAEMASEITIGLYQPIFSQIDPVHVGETGRALNIADHYMRRLGTKGKNFELDVIDTLISRYPSHGFVIDREEAELLFHQVRIPKELEARLITSLGNRVIRPEADGPVFLFLNEEMLEPANDTSQNNEKGEPNDIVGKEASAG